MFGKGSDGSRYASETLKRLQKAAVIGFHKVVAGQCGITNFHRYNILKQFLFIIHMMINKVHRFIVSLRSIH